MWKRWPYRETGGAAQNMSTADIAAGGMQATLRYLAALFDTVVVAARAHRARQEKEMMLRRRFLKTAGALASGHLTRACDALDFWQAKQVRLSGRHRPKSARGSMVGWWGGTILLLVTVLRAGRRPLKSPRVYSCLLYTSPSPRDGLLSRMPSSA